MNRGELIDSLLDVGFDLNRQAGARLINEAYGELVGGSQYIRDEMTLGDAGNGDTFAIPVNVGQVMSVAFGDQELRRVPEDEIRGLRSGRLVVDGWGGYAGVYSQRASVAGAPLVWTYGLAGQTGTLTASVALLPDPLPDDSAVPTIPSDFHGAILDKAIALAHERLNSRPDLAAVFNARFEDRKEKLRRAHNSRVRAGSVQARIAGVHF